MIVFYNRSFIDFYDAEWISIKPCDANVYSIPEKARAPLVTQSPTKVVPQRFRVARLRKKNFKENAEQMELATCA